MVFFQGENMMKTTDVSVGTTAEFEKYLHVCILYANHFAFISEEGTKELGWMALLSQLRYSDIISPDKAFYDAGRAAQQLKWAGTADVLFNFYLDWRECILHQNNGLVDYGQFEGSDIPTNVKIPTESSVSVCFMHSAKFWRPYTCCGITIKRTSWSRPKNSRLRFAKGDTGTLLLEFCSCSGRLLRKQPDWQTDFFVGLTYIKPSPIRVLELNSLDHLWTYLFVQLVVRKARTSMEETTEMLGFCLVYDY